MRCVIVIGVLEYGFFFQAEDGIRDLTVTGVQTCALPILFVPVGLSAFVFALGYIGLKEPAVVTGTDAMPPPAKKYEKSTLTIERGDAYLKRLDRKSVV